MTAYLAITRNKDGGFRLQLRQHLASTRPLMQSAREPSASNARREAQRLFGPLEWRTAPAAGLDQDYVVDVAVVTLEKGEW